MNPIKAKLFVGYLMATMTFFGESKSAEPIREWTSENGRKVSARLTEIDSEKKTISLSRSDGVEFELPIATLSFHDQVHVNLLVPKLEGTSVPPLSEDDPTLVQTLRNLDIEDEIEVRIKKKSRSSTKSLKLAKPIGYRERLHVAVSGDSPNSMAIDNDGKLLFLEGTEDPEHIFLVTPTGVVREVYRNPEVPDSRLDLPIVKASSQIAAWPNGGFFLSASWRVTNGKGFYGGSGYYRLDVGEKGIRAVPHFSKDIIPSGINLQTMSAFAGDRLIALRSRKEFSLFDLPQPSTTIPETRFSQPSDHSWEINLEPLLVISEAHVIGVASRDESRVVFLIDFENRTFSPLGPLATTLEEQESQLNTMAVSPNGKFLVHFNHYESAFKWIDLPMPE